MSETPATAKDAVDLAEPLTFPVALRGFWGWCVAKPLDAILLASLLAVLVYYFGFFYVFTNGRETAALWAWRGWNAENDLEHGFLVLPVALFIVWYEREQVRAAPKSPATTSGLIVTLLGVLIFIFSVRTLQQRVAILAFQVLIMGMVLFLWGKATARRVLFPVVFLIFMMPLGFLVSRTASLQVFTAAFAAKLSSLLGIAVASDGDKLIALDGSFTFEVAGGCSGIRSLTAMTMLAALYVHFKLDTFFKKALIFVSSLFFALLGNLMRIFTVVLFARFISPKIAGTLYHDWSGFIFFPFAVGAMAAFSTGLVNRDWSFLWRPDAPARLPSGASPDHGPPAPASGSGTTPARTGVPAATPKSASPISYDY